MSLCCCGETSKDLIKKLHSLLKISRWVVPEVFLFWNDIDVNGSVHSALGDTIDRDEAVTFERDCIENVYGDSTLLKQQLCKKDCLF